MGLKLTPRQRKALAPRKPIAKPMDVFGYLPMNPPTVTHQDKISKRGGGLVDSPTLKVAVRSYATLIFGAACPCAGPIRMSLHFRWCRDDKRYRRGRKMQHWEMYEQETWAEHGPDLDNAAKTLIDVLCRRGWIENDRSIVKLNLEKTEISPEDVRGPGVLVHFCSAFPYDIRAIEPAAWRTGLLAHPIGDPDAT